MANNGELNTDWMVQYGDMNYPDLGRRMVELKKEIDDVSQKKKDLQAEFDFLRLSVIPDKMENDEMSSIDIKGVGRLGLTLDAHVTVLKDNRGEFYAWLEENGHGGMIAPYAQPGTVKAWAKDMFKRDAEGEEDCELPEDLIKVEPFFRASITKK